MVEREAHFVANPARRANHFCSPESCQAPKSEIFRFTGILICGRHSPSPCRHEGRFAVVTKRGAGCDGRLRRQACFGEPGENAAAYGEIVWSWRRDRGVYPHPAFLGAATVTINAAHRGEHV